jgi:hypothetical protein
MTAVHPLLSVLRKCWSPGSRKSRTSSPNIFAALQVILLPWRFLTVSRTFGRKQSILAAYIQGLKFHVNSSKRRPPDVVTT